MSHCGTQSGLMSLPVLTTKQQCLFLCDTFFRRMCMRICYVHFCFQPAPQLQNYSSLINNYISGKLNLAFCIDICRDGAAAMTGQLSGFTTQVKELASECESVYCVIHRDAD
uniref:Uncharacterized protein n=1 Tax=Macaca fascicularis TaxID=9541 RepID=Q9GM17_MACFA|nr:hypothetical protein [Macaca fascicularis]